MSRSSREFLWLVLDIDGVLTDGTDAVSVGEKRIHLRDLDALSRARGAGMGIAFLTGEGCEIGAPVVERCGGGPALYGMKDKAEGLRRLAEELGCRLEELCYVGDGDRDAPALRLAGLGLAPSDASAPARAAADRVLAARGGRGAVEEATALLIGVENVDPEELTVAARGELGRAAEAIRAIADGDIGDLLRAIEMMAASLAAGGRIVLFGNGGSAAIAQHVATELVGRYRRDRKPLAAVALTADTALLTALANDFGYEQVFERQIQAHVRLGDVAIGMSTSGRSANVVRGLAAASRLGGRTVALVGAVPGAVGAEAEVCLTFAAPDTARIQEAHLTVLHVACSCLDRVFAGESVPEPEGT